MANLNESIVQLKEEILISFVIVTQAKMNAACSMTMDLPVLFNSHVAYLSLQSIFVQLQVLFGGSFLHELCTQLFNLQRE